jgi:hypothetical protein
MLFYNNMNHLQLSILLCILILVLLYINWKLGNIENPTKNNKPYYPRNIFKRYENALKENFVVDTEQLQKEIKNLNNPTNQSLTLNNNVKNMILNAVNNTVEDPENIISNKFLQEDDSVEDMMKKLNDMENMCSKIDKEQKMKDDLEQININKSALEELENQDKRIEELTEIVNHMRREKEKRDIITNKCRVNKQKTLDENYAKVQEMSKLGFLKDESRTVNVNVPQDGIKIDFSDITDKLKALKQKKNAPVVKKASTSNNNPVLRRGCQHPEDHGFNLNKLNNGICYKCNADVLKRDIDLIRRDFGKNI